jgi:hypothetical protein
MKVRSVSRCASESVDQRRPIENEWLPLPRRSPDHGTVAKRPPLRRVADSDENGSACSPCRTRRFANHRVENPKLSETLNAPEASGSVRHIVVVLGMHRSGTSLCTQVLHRLGVRLSDDLLPPEPDNEEGFFESSRILEINQRILKALGTGAADSVALRPLPARWWESPDLRVERAALADVISREAADQSRLWGFKDPRTAMLLPIWQKVFDTTGVEPIYILTVRHPSEVAASLAKRNRIPIEIGELLWLEHYLEVIRRAASNIAAVVDYRHWFTTRLAQAKVIAAAIGYRASNDNGFNEAALKKVVKAAVNPRLRHHENPDGRLAYAITSDSYGWLEQGDFSNAAQMVGQVEAALASVAQQITAKRSTA